MTRCLVMGAAGYLGTRLVELLVARGHEVRAFVRAPVTSYRPPGRVGIALGDATEPADVAAALRGIDVVYYLVHSLRSKDFGDADRRAATVLAEQARCAGVRQLVYVGGTRPSEARVSPHLASRAEVGDILAAGAVPALILQASMIIGAGSTSFALLREASVGLPVIPRPGWMNRRSRPVAEADVLHYLTTAAENPSIDGVFDVSGPETLSYLELVQRCARVTGRAARVPVPVPFWSHRLAARLTGLLTPTPVGVAAALFESLDHDLLPTAVEIADRLPGPAAGPTSVDRAIRAAVAAEDDTPGGTPYVDDRTVRSDADPAEVWRTIVGLGGREGWHTLPLVWAVRGTVDHLLGGVGRYRGRQTELAAGDVVDFWTVLRRDDRNRRLVLRADLKMPGRTVLEMSVTRDEQGTRYRQKITFTPDGLPGTLYWLLQKPAHDLVFATMALAIASPGRG